MQGLAKMAAEGSLRAFWRGNGANVAKNIPEMVRPDDFPAFRSIWQKR